MSEKLNKRTMNLSSQSRHSNHIRKSSIHRPKFEMNLELKINSLLKLVKEWTFYFMVFSLMSLVVNVKLFCSLVQDNFNLFKSSINESIIFFKFVLLKYRRFLLNYYQKLTLVLNSNDPSELENLNFSLIN